MSNWNPNSNKHKAKHGGYSSRPAKRDIAALMQMMAGCSEAAKSSTVKKIEGAQLKLKF